MNKKSAPRAPRTQIGITLNADVLEKAKALADAKYLPLSRLIEQLLLEAIKKEESP